MRRLVAAVIFVMILLLPLCAFSQGILTDDYTQSFSLKPMPAAYGGAYRAVADTAGSMVLNPSAMAFYPRVDLSVDWMTTSYNNSDLLSASVYDNVSTGGYAVGFSYDSDSLQLAGTDLDVKQFTGAIAGRLFNYIAFGISVQYYTVSSSRAGAAEPSGWTGDVGITLRPVDMLSVALVGYNILDGGSDERFPPKIGGGVTAWMGDTAKISLDWEHDFVTDRDASTNIYFGGDIRLAEGIYMSGGFGGDMIYDDPFLSFGLHFRGPRAVMTFTLIRRLNPGATGVAAGFDLMALVK